MTLSAGDAIPTTPAFTYLPPKINGACSYMPISVDISKQARKLLIVIVPGAFTPTCSEHIPPYLTSASIEALRSSGIKQVLIASVDSPFITSAWAESLIEDKDETVKSAVQDGYLKFVSDAGAEWLQKCELASEPVDLFAKGGFRGLRTAIIVNEDGNVDYVGIDEKKGSVEKSGIDGVLAALG